MYGITKHADDIFLCLQKNSPLPLSLNPGRDASLNLSSKAQRKVTLKTLKTSKKLKYMDDPKVAEVVRLTTLKDEWLIACGKPTPETKARIKKVVEAEKKKAEKEDKAREKAKRKSQAMDIRRLAISNSRRVVGAFKKILSDLQTGPEASNVVLDLSEPTVPDIPRPEPTSHTLKGLFSINTRFSKRRKRKATQQTLVKRLKSKTPALKRAQTLTPPPAAIELIRPG